MIDSTQGQIEKLLQKFAATPARIAAAVEGKTSEQLTQRRDQESWTATDILAHLRAADEIVSTRIYMILARDEPPLIAFDERRWAEIAHYTTSDFQTSLTLLTLRRAEHVATLRQLALPDWQRSGKHEALGDQSLLAILQNITGHEEEHCTQIEALFKA